MSTLIDQQYCTSKFDIANMNGCIPEINWFDGKSVAFYGDWSMNGWGLVTPLTTPIPTILKTMLNLSNADTYASSLAKISTPAAVTLKQLITATPAKYDVGIVIIGMLDFDASHNLGEYPQIGTSYSYDSDTGTISNGIAQACIEWQSKFSGPLIWITYPPRTDDPLSLTSATTPYNLLGLDEVTKLVAGYLFQCPIVDSSNYTFNILSGDWTEEDNMQYCRVLAHELGKIFL